MNTKETKAKIGIVGLGLIGGSLSLALKNNFFITGMDINPESVSYSLKNNIIDIATTSYLGLVGCDVIFVCVPVQFVRQTVCDVYNAVGESAIITDVASVKGILNGCNGRIVGGHPMAGTEHSGISSAKQGLFDGAFYYLVRYDGTTQKDYDYIYDVVQSIGARAVCVSAEAHDKTVSRTSHLPHMVAYTLAGAAIQNGGSEYAGSGLMDTTRIASSDSEFWASVAMLNKNNLLEDMRKYLLEFSDLMCMIQSDDFVGVQKYLSNVKKKRDSLVKAKKNLK